MKKRWCGFLTGVAALCLIMVTPVYSADMPEKDTEQKSFKVGVTQLPMYSLVSALAYGSPVNTVLIEKDNKGQWLLPDDLTVVFWTGKHLEPELAKQLEATQQASVALMEAAGVHQLPARTPADWKKQSEAGKENMESPDWGYGIVQTIRPEGVIDTRYWLDPLNAMAALEAVKMIFQGLDQRNHWAYNANADQIVQALWELDIRVSKLFHEISGKPFVVLQDEFQYMENRYRLTTVPAGGSARDIADKAKERKAQCVVSTLPFDQKLQTVLDKAGLKTVVLDPAGKMMPAATGAYFKWYGNLVSQLNGCVASSDT
jgi:ABC-type Zn2+ transport system substrate-binding protein/surface adhesin